MCGLISIWQIKRKNILKACSAPKIFILPALFFHVSHIIVSLEFQINKQQELNISSVGGGQGARLCVWLGGGVNPLQKVKRNHASTYHYDVSKRVSLFGVFFDALVTRILKLLILLLIRIDHNLQQMLKVAAEVPLLRLLESVIQSMVDDHPKCLDSLKLSQSQLTIKD